MGNKIHKDVPLTSIYYFNYSNLERIWWRLFKKRAH